MSVEIILNRYTLILGDVGTGKTLLTSKFIKELIRLGYDGDMYIIDLAPNIRNLGSRLSKYVYGFRNSIYRYSREIKAPRTEADSPEILREYIERNYHVSLEFFKDFLKSGRKILVVNDLSIFLHYGEVSELLNFIEYSDTFLGNSYYGVEIVDRFGLGIDEVEREKVLELARYMDNVIRL